MYSGNVQNYLRMDLDYREQTEVKLYMIKSLESLLQELP